MHLRRPIVAAALALLLAACGDPDGPTLTVPDRGLEGAWVRIDLRPPSPSSLYLPLPDDTVFFYPNRGGLWSREFVVDEAGVQRTVRSCPRLRYTTDGPRILVTMRGDAMTAGSAECPAIEALPGVGDLAVPAPPASPRRLTMAPGPHWEIRREGRDRLLVRSIGTEVVLTEWYRRVTWPPVD